jgi:hypothetical protein
MDKLIKQFKNPAPEYRSSIFWAWNDDLNIPQLKIQLNHMKNAGMAGGFMHSREGLITPYMKKEWNACVKSMVAYAKQLKIPIYLYDEDRWPSGFAGGIVTKHEKNRMKMLKAEKKSGAAGAIAGDAGTASTWSFTPITSPVSKWFNNNTYLDTLNKDAVGDFIKSTYVLYKKLIGKEFGKIVPGIFTDEPNYRTFWIMNPDVNTVYLPWTDGFDTEFKTRYGYDLTEKFSCLVDQTGDYMKVRYDYYKLLTDLFVINYGKQIYDWCEKNGIAFTGHYLCEDTVYDQIVTIGNAMPLYEYEHFPGIDHLCRQVDTVYLTAKQCSSVSHQLNKKRVLSELFGCSGQNMTFMDRKWIGNFNALLGVNLFCPHLWLYSMAGERKRDYPPTLSYQQPWFKYNKIIEDYFARINFIETQGRFNANVAVINPVESGWCVFNHQDRKPCDDLNNKYVSMLRELSGNHYDYDLVDESLLAKYGSLHNSSIQVGEMRYHVVVIPQLLTLRKSTIELLDKFVDYGGTVIVCSPVPERVEGEPDKMGLLGEFLLGVKIAEGTTELIKAIETAIPRDITIIDASGTRVKDIYYQHRVLETKDVYFLVNINKYKGYKTKIMLDVATPSSVLQNWDAVTGEITVIETKTESGRITAELDFQPAGTFIIVQDDAPELKTKLAAYQPVSELAHAADLKKGWVIKNKSNLNTLTVDHCQYKTGDMADWSEQMYVLDVQNTLVQKLKEKMPLSVKYTFKTKLSKQPNPVYLAIERPKLYKIKVNGTAIKYKNIGWWTDTAFKKIDITKLLNLSGDNTVELTGKFVNPVKFNSQIYVKGATEIESIYVLGNFSVDGTFRDVTMQDINPGDKTVSGGWPTELNKEVMSGIAGENFVIKDASDPDLNKIVQSGYPFYAGSFTVTQEINWTKPVKQNEKVYLTFDELEAITVKITVNKKAAGIIVWQPYRVDITKFIKKGKNTVEIEITNSLRNLLGPHHMKYVNPEGVGPGSFNDKANWCNHYTFTPFSLPKISLKIG